MLLGNYKIYYVRLVYHQQIGFISFQIIMLQCHLAHQKHLHDGCGYIHADVKLVMICGVLDINNLYGNGRNVKWFNLYGNRKKGKIF